MSLGYLNCRTFAKAILAFSVRDVISSLPVVTKLPRYLKQLTIFSCSLQKVSASKGSYQSRRTTFYFEDAKHTPHLNILIAKRPYIVAQQGTRCKSSG